VGGGRCMGAVGICAHFVFGFISTIVMEVAYVWDCRGLRLCTVGTVG
jgi:hypothetical protein